MLHAPCIILLQAVVAFLRNRTYVSQLCRNLRSRGLVGLSEMLIKLSVPSFAKWRWLTLNECCKAVMKVWCSFAQHFDPSLFDHVRDSTSISLVTRAARSTLFTVRFRCVAWISSWLGALSSWIGGCECHEHEFLRHRCQFQFVVCFSPTSNPQRL